MGGQLEDDGGVEAELKAEYGKVDIAASRKAGRTELKTSSFNDGVARNAGAHSEGRGVSNESCQQRNFSISWCVGLQRLSIGLGNSGMLRRQTTGSTTDRSAAF